MSARRKTDPSLFKIGTKIEDPLVRYSEYAEGRYRPCWHCSTMFTHLGLKHHLRACPSNPENKKRGTSALRRVK